VITQCQAGHCFLVSQNNQCPWCDLAAAQERIKELEAESATQQPNRGLPDAQMSSHLEPAVLADNHSLEMAARVCEEIAKTNRAGIALMCADEIRALKSTEVEQNAAPGSGGQPNRKTGSKESPAAGRCPDAAPDMPEEHIYAYPEGPMVSYDAWCELRAYAERVTRRYESTLEDNLRKSNAVNSAVERAEAQQAEIERLRAQLSEGNIVLTNDDIDAMHAKLPIAPEFLTIHEWTAIFCQVREANELRAELAEAQKDAARYRWLNAQDNFLAYIEQPDGTKRYRLKCGEPLDRWIDAAIDAARSK
jgi:hypothetical protein